MTISNELARISRGLGEIQAYDATMPSQRIQVLLEIAGNPGITAKEITAKFEVSTGAESISRSAVTRHVAALAGRAGGGFKDGLEPLVEDMDDPNDRRYQRLYLTHTGRHAVREMLRKVYGDEVANSADLRTLKDARMGR